MIILLHFNFSSFSSKKTRVSIHRFNLLVLMSIRLDKLRKSILSIYDDTIASSLITMIHYSNFDFRLKTQNSIFILFAIINLKREIDFIFFIICSIRCGIFFIFWIIHSLFFGKKFQISFDNRLNLIGFIILINFLFSFEIVRFPFSAFFLVLWTYHNHLYILKNYLYTKEFVM